MLPSSKSTFPGASISIHPQICYLHPELLIFASLHFNDFWMFIVFFGSPHGFRMISMVFPWDFHGISIQLRPSPVVIPGPAAVGAAQRLRGPKLAQPRHAAAAGGTPGGAAGGAARAPRASHPTLGIMGFLKGNHRESSQNGRTIQVREL